MPQHICMVRRQPVRWLSPSTTQAPWLELRYWGFPAQLFSSYVNLLRNRGPKTTPWFTLFWFLLLHIFLRTFRAISLQKITIFLLSCSKTPSPCPPNWKTSPRTTFVVHDYYKHETGSLICLLNYLYYQIVLYSILASPYIYILDFG